MSGRKLLDPTTYMSYRFVDSFQAGSVCSILTLLESCLQLSKNKVNGIWRALRFECMK